MSDTSATDSLRAAKQHGVIPGLNRGPYQTWPPDSDLIDRINHVIEHLYGLPCPGCKDAVTLLQEFRAVANPPLDLKPIELTDTDRAFIAQRLHEVSTITGYPVVEDPDGEEDAPDFV